MRLLIIEDEQPAARRLQSLLLKIRPEAEIVNVLEAVDTSIEWLKKSPQLDLIFMDIQLADGLSFDIFQQITLQVPVIFTTAYDEYAIKAFRVNSVDYLLKPIDPDELSRALQKYDQLFHRPVHYAPETIEQLLTALTRPSHKERFIVKIGQQFTYINTDEIAYFYSEDGRVYALLTDGKKHFIDSTIEKLTHQLNSARFFRINRKIILAITCIHKIAPHLGGRLKVMTVPKSPFDFIVSRDRASDFKSWLDD